MLSLARAAEQFVAHCRYTKALSKNTSRAYQQDLTDLRRSLGSRIELSAIRRSEIERHIQRMLSVRHLSAATARRRFRTLKVFFAWAHGARLIRKNPLADFRLRIHVPRRLPRTITREELRELICAASREAKRARDQSARLAAANTYCGIVLMASTGIRVAELCAIEVGDIDLQSARIRIHGKGSRERIVYVMNADVSGAIRLVLVCRDKVKGMQNSSLLVEPSGGLVAPQHFASCYMAWCGVQVCVGA